MSIFKICNKNENIFKYKFDNNFFMLYTKTIVIIVLVILILLGFYFGSEYIKKQPYQPDVKLTLSKDKLEVKNNQLSDDIITTTITKLDEKGISTNFTLKFNPSDPDYVYAVSVNTNQTLTQQETRNLIFKDSSDQIQFKVFGKIMGNQPYSPYTIKIELYYNNNLIDSKILNVQVNR